MGDYTTERIRYRTIADLKRAYDSGELTAESPLHVDNDDSFVYVGEEKVYSGGGYEDVYEALDALKIPWRRA